MSLSFPFVPSRVCVMASSRLPGRGVHRSPPGGAAHSEAPPRFAVSAFLRLGGELARPAHPLGGRVGVVAELLSHPAYAATDAEVLHGTSDCLGHHVGRWGV